MEETRESRAEQPELRVINLDRKPVRGNKKRVTGREYRRMLRTAALAFGVSLGVNIAQAIMIYILQAGPM